MFYPLFEKNGENCSLDPIKRYLAMEVKQKILLHLSFFFLHQYPNPPISIYKLGFLTHGVKGMYFLLTSEIIYRFVVNVVTSLLSI